MIFKSLRSVLFFSVFFCAAAADAQTAEKAQATPPSELTVDDGKPDGVLTIDVSADGEKSHSVFAGVSRVVYVVGESLNGPGPVLRAPKGAYSGPTNRAADGPSAAGKPIILAFSHGKGRVVVIGDAGIASAFGSRGGVTHRGISEEDNALFVRNVIRWLAK